MNLLFAGLYFFLALAFALAGLTRIGEWMIERRNPPVGEFAEIDGARIHYVHVPAGPTASLPPIVFIHGASANLKDQMLPLRPLLEGKAEMLFLDRPGHGWSERGSSNNDTQEGQAAAIAALMDDLGIKKAIVVAHSFGGSTATAFVLNHPDRTAGLVFLAAATHPWEGGRTSWYYHLTATPVVGRLFSEMAALPAGWRRMTGAAACVFAPNEMPENYTRDASIALVLRPSAFRANAIDVQSLYPYALKNSSRYPDIKAPAVIISGNRDTVVYEEIHSIGLGRDIAGSELVWISNLGHKPDWIAPELVVAAIEKIAGQPRDLQALAREVEARISMDAYGAGSCYDPDEPAAQLSVSTPDAAQQNPAYRPNRAMKRH